MLGFFLKSKGAAKTPTTPKFSILVRRDFAEQPERLYSVLHEAVFSREVDREFLTQYRRGFSVSIY